MPILSRRAFLRGALVSTIASGPASYAYARMVEPGWLDVTRLDLPLRRLPDAFADFTIAQISDLHFGPLVSLAFLEKVVDAVLALGADAIVITGDIVSRVSQGEPDMVVQCLSRLHAPHGVYAILGNHDWWENGYLVAETVRETGITLLSNAHCTLQKDGQTLYLAGLDDVWCGKHDLAKALTGIPSDAAVMALIHEPDYADTVANDARVILQLSGHSHGGQVRIPFYGGLYFPPWARKYTEGLYQIGSLALYTNRGIGTVSWPIRFACRPEVTLFTLKPTN